MPSSLARATAMAHSISNVSTSIASRALILMHSLEM